MKFRNHLRYVIQGILFLPIWNISLGAFAQTYDLAIWGETPSAKAAVEAASDYDLQIAWILPAASSVEEKEFSNVEMLYTHQTLEVEKTQNRIKALRVSMGDSLRVVEANVFIDASLQGDLLPKAEVPFHTQHPFIAEDFQSFDLEGISATWWQYADSIWHVSAPNHRLKGYISFSISHAIARAKSAKRPPIQRNTILGGYTPAMLHVVTQGDSLQFEALPFTIPYFAIVAPKVENLLVCHAISATPLMFALLQSLEVQQGLGKAAGVAASLSLKTATSPKKLPVELIQRDILRQGGTLLYFSDLTTESPYFEVAQYFGLRGYFEDVAFQPEKRVSQQDANQWQFLAGTEVTYRLEKTTRGAFLQQLFKKLNTR